jgi:hypothetical protein
MIQDTTNSTIGPPKKTSRRCMDTLYYHRLRVADEEGNSNQPGKRGKQLLLHP